jgi:tetratricopeptide (TPR) repeat protein
VPVLSGLSAYALACCRRFRLPTVVVVIPFLLPVPLYVYNHLRDIDTPEQVRGHFLRDLSEAQSQVGDRRLEAAKLAQAESRYRSAIELWGGNVPAHDGLGAVYMRQGRLDDAIGEFETVARLRPEQMATQYRVYNAYCLRRDFAAAAAVLRRAVQKAPQDAQARLALAWMLATCPDARARDGDEALRNAQAARRLVGNDRYDVLDVLAAAHAELGQFDRALTLAEQAAKQASQHGHQDQARLIEQRVVNYREGKPCRAPPRPIGTH